MDKGVRDRPPSSSREKPVCGLTPAELATIRERLEAFADDLFALLPRADQCAPRRVLPARVAAGRPP
jgi:hypothetical protein